MSFEGTTDDPGQCIRHKKGKVKIKEGLGWERKH